MRCAWNSSHLESLHNRGYFVRDNVLSDRDFLEVRQYAQSLCDEGRLNPARIGNNQLDANLRGDSIFWLDRTHPRLDGVFQVFDSLRNYLQDEAFIKIESVQYQLAHYPPGSVGYHKHRDTSPYATSVGPKRKYTNIFYLNQNYISAHGGQLGLFTKVDDVKVEIEPVGNRIVTFESQLEHEVLPTHSSRLAITAWFYSWQNFVWLWRPNYDK